MCVHVYIHTQYTRVLCFEQNFESDILDSLCSLSSIYRGFGTVNQADSLRNSRQNDSRDSQKPEL